MSDPNDSGYYYVGESERRALREAKQDNIRVALFAVGILAAVILMAVMMVKFL